MTMGMGIGELIAILLLGGLLPSDLEPLPPDQIMRAMPADCEVVAFQDLRGAWSTLNQTVSDLSTQPWLVSNREAAEGLRELSEILATAPSRATAEIGFDPFSTVNAVGFCGRLGTGPSGDPVPSVLVIVQGDFDATLASSVAGRIGLPTVTLSNGVSVYGDTEDGVVFGFASPVPGLLLFGSEDLLAPRAAGTMPSEWSSAPADSLVGRLREIIVGGPRTMIGFQPSAGTRFLIGGEAPVSLGQLVAGLDRIMILTNSTTTYIEARATNADALRDHELLLSGFGAYAEAAPLVMRAFANVIFGMLSADDPEIEEPLRSLLGQREQVLAFAEDMGLFAEADASYTSDASTMTTSLTIQGSGGGAQSLGALMMVGGIMSFGIMRAGGDSPYYEEIPPPMAPAVVAPPAPAGP